jgi:hypothetical protein
MNAATKGWSELLHVIECKNAEATLRKKMTGWDGGNRCCAVAEADATTSRDNSGSSWAAARRSGREKELEGKSHVSQTKGKG